MGQWKTSCYLGDMASVAPQKFSTLTYAISMVTINQRLTLQTGHFLTLSAHWLHIVVWPHGSKRTLAVKSSHKKQSLFSFMCFPSPGSQPSMCMPILEEWPLSCWFPVESLCKPLPLVKSFEVIFTFCMVGSDGVGSSTPAGGCLLSCAFVSTSLDDPLQSVVVAVAVFLASVFSCFRCGQ